jgi:hypothetical protein
MRLNSHFCDVVIHAECIITEGHIECTSVPRKTGPTDLYLTRDRGRFYVGHPVERRKFSVSIRNILTAFNAKICKENSLIALPTSVYPYVTTWTECFFAKLDIGNVIKSVDKLQFCLKSNSVTTTSRGHLWLSLCAEMGNPSPSHSRVGKP